MMSSKSTAGYAKRVWSCEEDAMLTNKINELGIVNWNVIASFVPSRSGKQCRERWHNHLAHGGYRKGDWTKEEDEIIVSSHAKLGNQWSNITKLLEGRSCNDVKNRFYSLERLDKRIEQTEQPQISPPNNCIYNVIPYMNHGYIHPMEVTNMSNFTNIFNYFSPSHDSYNALINHSFISPYATHSVSPCSVIINLEHELSNKCSRYSKKSWSKEEDDLLINQVATLGVVNWNVIASFVPERSGKQCRERWHNHLANGGYKKGNWSQQEDEIIMSAHAKLGTQWANISKLLSGRSCNDVKNRYHTLERIEKRSESSLDLPEIVHKQPVISMSTSAGNDYSRRSKILSNATNMTNSMSSSSIKRSLSDCYGDEPTPQATATAKCLKPTTAIITASATAAAAINTSAVTTAATAVTTVRPKPIYRKVSLESVFAESVEKVEYYSTYGNLPESQKESSLDEDILHFQSFIKNINYSTHFV